MLKRKIKIKNKSRHLLFLISAFLLVIGIFLLAFKYYNLHEIRKQDDKNIEIFFQETSQVSEEENIPVKQEENKQKTTINYVAILEIPKINLKKGLVSKTSHLNNVNRNIYTLKESTFPDESEHSHIILASHSGSGYYSYFNHLNQLNLNDKVLLYYKGIKYIYEVINKYDIEKNGTASLKLTDSSDITLITCISGTNKQVVFIGKLIEKENY